MRRRNIYTAAQQQQSTVFILLPSKCYTKSLLCQRYFQGEIHASRPDQHEHEASLLSCSTRHVLCFSRMDVGARIRWGHCLVPCHEPVQLFLILWFSEYMLHLNFLFKLL